MSKSFDFGYNFTPNSNLEPVASGSGVNNFNGLPSEMENGLQGSIIARVNIDNSSNSNGLLISLRQDNNNNRAELFATAANTDGRLTYINVIGSQTELSHSLGDGGGVLGDARVSGEYETGICWDENSIEFYTNGTLMARYEGSQPAYNQMGIGVRHNSTLQTQYNIDSWEVYDKKLSRSQMERLTKQTNNGLVVNPIPVFDPDLNLIISSGQSNDSGRDDENLTYVNPIENRKLLNNAGLLVPYSDPFDDATGSLFPFNDDPAAASSYAGGVIDNLVTYQNGIWGVVPANKGATPVDGPVNGWALDLLSADGDYQTGSVAWTALQKIRYAMRVGRVRAYVWNQGESNAVSGTDEITFKTATRNWLTEVNNVTGAPVILVSLHKYVVGETPGLQTDWENILQWQRDLSSEMKFVHFVDMSDREGAVGDRVHYNTEDNVVAARRIAEKIDSVIRAMNLDMKLLMGGDSLSNGFFTAQGQNELRASLSGFFENVEVIDFAQGGMHAYRTVAEYDNPVEHLYFWDDQANPPAPGARYEVLIQATNPDIDKNVPTAMVFNIGTNDENSSTGGGVTLSKSDYKSNLTDLFEYMLIDFPNLRYIFVPVYHRRDITSTELGNTNANTVTDALIELTEELSYVHRISGIYDLDMFDASHLNDADRIISAERFAEGIAKIVNGASYTTVLGPQVSSASLLGDQITVEVNHENGTDLTVDVNSWVAHKAIIDGSVTDVEDIVKIDNDTLKFLLPEGQGMFSGDTDLRIGYGYMEALSATNTEAIRDNTRLTFPLSKSITDVQVTEDVVQNLRNIHTYVAARPSAKTYATGTSVSQINGLFGSNNCVTDPNREPDYDKTLFDGAGGLKTSDLTTHLESATPLDPSKGFSVHIVFKVPETITAEVPIFSLSNQFHTGNTRAKLVVSNSGQLRWADQENDNVVPIAESTAGNSYYLAMSFEPGGKSARYSLNGGEWVEFDPHDAFLDQTTFILFASRPTFNAQLNTEIGMLTVTERPYSDGLDTPIVNLAYQADTIYNLGLNLSKPDVWIEPQVFDDHQWLQNTASISPFITLDDLRRNNYRLNEATEIALIKAASGIPDDIEVGTQTGQTVGLTDENTLVFQANILDVDNETEAAAESVSGDGTAGNPYVIQNRDVNVGGSNAQAARVQGNFHVRFENCRLAGGNSRTFIGLAFDGNCTFRNCEFYNDQTTASVHVFSTGEGTYVFENCLWSGCEDGAGVVVLSAAAVTFTNCRVDASRTNWMDVDSFYSCIDANTVTNVQYFTADCSASSVLPYSVFRIDALGANSTFQNIYIKGFKKAFTDINPAGSSTGDLAVKTNMTIRYIEVEEIEQECIELIWTEGLLLEHFYFKHSPLANAYRMILLTADFTTSGVTNHNATIRYGRMRSDSPDDIAANEIITYDICPNIHIHHIWCEAAPEDVIEPRFPAGGGNIHDIVGENTVGAVVNAWQAFTISTWTSVDTNEPASAGDDSGLYVRRIYGDSGRHGVAMEGTKDGVIHDIYVTNNNSSVADVVWHPVQIKDRDLVGGNTNIVRDWFIAGPLTLPVDREGVSAVDFRVVDNSHQARYFDNQNGESPVTIQTPFNQIPFTKPSLFTWDYESEYGAIYTQDQIYRNDYDLSPHENPAGTTVYLGLASQGASSANDGLTPATPKDDLQDCLNIAGASKVVVVHEGFYSRNETWGTAGPTFFRNTSIVKEASLTGDVIFAMATPIVRTQWDAVGGFSNVYSAPYNAAEIVIDRTNLDANGVPTPLVAVSTVADCQATPNSWVRDGELHIHTFDSRNPELGSDNDIVAFRNNFVGLEIDQNFDLHMKGINVWGGNNGAVYYGTTGDYPNSRFFAENCNFSYSDIGVSFYNNRGGYIKNCQSYYCKLDGFSTFTNQTTLPKVMITGTVSKLHGLETVLGTSQDGFDQNANAFTSHTGNSLVCLECEGDQTDGPLFAFVNPGTEVILLGCTAGESLNELQGDATDACFRATDGVNMWVKDWQAGDSFYSLVKTGFTGTVTDLGGGVDNSQQGTFGVIVNE